MTDSQEAEDVARLVERFNANAFFPLGPADADLLRPLLARLVREGQIRCLEELLTQEWVTREAGLDRRSVSSSALHARIAALKGEG